MKLLRFGPVGTEKPGALDETGTIRDLSSVSGDLAGENVSLDAIKKLQGVDLSTLPAAPEGVRIGSCSPRPHLPSPVRLIRSSFPKTARKPIGKLSWELSSEHTRPMCPRLTRSIMWLGIA